MALDVKKQTMETEAVVSTQTAQTIIQAEAMVSGAGRDAVEVLMEDATVNISGMEVQAGRLLVDGTVICQAVYRQGDADVIRAVEARGPVQHGFEDEAIAVGMNAAVEATVNHVEAGYLNGRILFRVTVELHETVCGITATEVVTGVEGVDGAECETLEIDTARNSAEAVAQTIVTETLSLPQELATQATLMDFASVTVEKAERDLGGVAVSGRVNAEVMIASSLPGRPVAMVKYPMAFRQLVEMPEWLTETVRATALVRSIRSTLVDGGAQGEMGLRLDADVDISVRAIQTQKVSCVSNAYATGKVDLQAEQQPVSYTSAITVREMEDTFKGTLLIPENAPRASTVLASVARPTVSATFNEKGRGVVEGVLEFSALYMPSGGERPVTVRDELPFRLNMAQPIDDGSYVQATVSGCEASALMADRLEVRCTIRLRCIGREQQITRVVVDVTASEPKPRRAGIVMFWPGKEDSIWSIGQRYHVPVEEVRRENGGVDVIRPGHALILRI